MTEHSYHVFDPDIPDAAYNQSSSAYIAEWAHPVDDKDIDIINGVEALKQWSAHSFVDASKPEPVASNLTAAYTKSHKTSMVLRTAEQHIYCASSYAASQSEPGVEPEKQKVGYFVELPENLSSRQIYWLDLILPPTQEAIVLLTIEEYTLLKHLKVISGIHKKQSVYLYKIPYRPLIDAIKENISDYDMYISCLKPQTSQALMMHFSWWIASLPKNPTQSEKKPVSYKTYTAAHLELIIRNERINQLKALVYAHYYIDHTVFLGETHKIEPYWISRQPVGDATALTYQVFCQDGWFRSVHPGNQLTLALVTLATVGYWSVDCDESDSSDLLTTTIEGFLMAHHSNNPSATRLQNVVYKPSNPFDMKPALFKHNGLMPVLAATCQHPYSSIGELAAYFDTANPKEFTDILLNSDNDKTRDALIMQLLDKLRCTDNSM